jgi:hypothetical protein
MADLMDLTGEDAFRELEIKAATARILEYTADVNIDMDKVYRAKKGKKYEEEMWVRKTRAVLWFEKLKENSETSYTVTISRQEANIDLHRHDTGPDVCSSGYRYTSGESEDDGTLIQVSQKVYARKVRPPDFTNIDIVDSLLKQAHLPWDMQYSPSEVEKMQAKLDAIEERWRDEERVDEMMRLARSIRGQTPQGEVG